MRCPGFRHPGVPQHLRSHSPVPSPGSQRALRAIRKGIADSSVDDSRVTCFRASPTLGRTGTFFGESPVVLSLSGEGFASPGLEQDAETAHVARRPMFKTFPAVRQGGVCVGVAAEWVRTGPSAPGHSVKRVALRMGTGLAAVRPGNARAFLNTGFPDGASDPTRRGAVLLQPACAAGKPLSGRKVLARPAERNRACTRRPCRVSLKLGKHANTQFEYSCLWRCVIMRANALFIWQQIAAGSHVGRAGNVGSKGSIPSETGGVGAAKRPPVKPWPKAS